MFKYIKKIFDNKNKIKETIENKPITFKDLQLQDIVIQVKPNGNNTMLELINLTNNDILIFNPEQCLFLAAIFNEYGTTEKITKILSLLNETSKKDENTNE